MKLSLYCCSPIAAAAGLLLVPTADAQLVHRYSFDGTGTTVTDSAGSANGTLVGGAALTGSGQVTLDGVDGYVDLPPSLISPYDVVTVEIWSTWTDTSGQPWQRLLDFGDSDAGPGLQGNGLTYFIIAATAQSPAEQVFAMRSSTAITSQKLHAGQAQPTFSENYVAITFDSPANTMSMYVDGVHVDTRGVQGNLMELNDENCWLGRSQFSNNPNFNGSLNEVRIHSSILTPSEIATSFSLGPDGNGTLGTHYCGPAPVNSTGGSASMGAFGSLATADNNLTLQASGMPNASFGYFLTSRMQGLTVMPNGSQGNLCLAGSIGRFIGPGQIQNSGATGSISLTIDLTQHPTPTGLVSVMAGDTWNFQGWFRDSLMGNLVSNFTDGLELTFN